MVKRLGYFVFGIASYIVFLSTFLYAIAFVGGFGVGNRLDGPLTGSLSRAIAIDTSLLLVFALQHSIMARGWFKERFSQILPWAIERSTYVMCASLALLLLIWQWCPLGLAVWTIDDVVGRGVMWALFGLGWLIVLCVTFLISHFDLFGLRQVWMPLIGRVYTPVEFRTPLPYRVIRHPLYFGFLLAFWMTPVMTAAHLLFAAGTTAYIIVAISFEERDLVAQHGDSYRLYRLSVPMLIPGCKPRRPPI